MLETFFRAVGRIALSLSLVSGLSVLLEQPVPERVFAVHYRPGLMERVARNRKMPIVDCMMSSPWHKLNTWMRVESQVNGRVSYCRTTDVSAPADRARHRRNKIIELDWTSAKRLCSITRVGEKPARACPVDITVVTKQEAEEAIAAMSAKTHPQGSTAPSEAVSARPPISLPTIWSAAQDCSEPKNRQSVLAQ